MTGRPRLEGPFRRFGVVYREHTPEVLAIVDRPRTHEIIEVQRRVSRDFGCAFFDLVAFGGGPLSMVRWSETEPRYAQRDLVHFTGRAYRRLGEVLTMRLMDGYE